MDYKRNAKYFRPVPKISPKAILAIIIAGVIGWFINPLIPIGIAVLTVIILVMMFSGRPTDAEIDAAAESFMSDLEKRALKKLGVEKEEVAQGTPIKCWGYCFGSSMLKDNANQKLSDKKGGDGHWRSPEVYVYAFYFSNDQIHYYQAIRSLVSNSIKETTEEYFYKDVVSVKTYSDDVPAWDSKTNSESKTERAHVEGFMIRNTGGESTECSVMNSGTAERSVNSLRSLLKQKKLG